MKRSALRASFFVAAVFSLSLFAKPPIPKDLILTTIDGQNLVLHEDNSWVFQNGNKSDIEKDFTVPVDGGKIILIAVDGTWGYVDKEIIDPNDLVITDTVVGRGRSVQQDIEAAKRIAEKQAFDQVLAKTKSALRDKRLKIDGTLLADCLRRVEKDIDSKEVHTKGAGWDAVYTITLDKGSLFAIAECAKKPEPPAKADSSSTKTTPAP